MTNPESRAITRERVSSAPKNGLLFDDAIEALKGILKYALEAELDEDGLRAAITAHGFDGESADVDDCGNAGYSIRVWGPDNEILDVSTLDVDMGVA